MGKLTAAQTLVYTPHCAPLPRLEMVRDSVRMRRVFESLMPQHCIETCSIVHTRYKLGKHKSCLVCYRLTIRCDERADSQIMYGRFYAPGESLPRFRQAQQRPLAAPVFGTALYHLPELEGVVWAFPNDRRVPGIPALLDRRRIAGDVVPRLVREVGADAAVEEASVEVAQYIPEWGCTVRVTANLAGWSSLVFYGKAYHSQAGEETYRSMCTLWRAPQRQAWFGMAQPLAYEPEHLILWRTSVDGVTLASLESDPSPGFLSLLEGAGRAVAALHSIPVPGLQPETLADVCAHVQETAGRLAQIRPRLARRVTSLRSWLLAEAGSLEARPAATLHGDLHTRNLLSTGSGIAIIDFDDMRAGDPLAELGSFLASICQRGFEHQLGAAYIAEMGRSVLRGYELGSPSGLARRVLRWYTAAGLLFEADGAVAYVKACGPEALLAAAEGARHRSGLLESVL